MNRDCSLNRRRHVALWNQDTRGQFGTRRRLSKHLGSSGSYRYLSVDSGSISLERAAVRDAGYRPYIKPREEESLNGRFRGMSERVDPRLSIDLSRFPSYPVVTVTAYPPVSKSS